MAFSDRLELYVVRVSSNSLMEFKACVSPLHCDRDIEKTDMPVDILARGNLRV